MLFQDQALTIVIQCNALALSFGADKVAESNDQAVYDDELSEFWSAQQSNTTPACLFRPVQSKEVSAAILLSRLTQCPFAVKSGGHAAFKGASNVESGLTIDLASLRQVSLSQGGDIVSIGTGNTWHDVYTALEPFNRIAVGGRVASVGVGGLTLGGMYYLPVQDLLPVQSSVRELGVQDLTLQRWDILLQQQIRFGL